MCYQYQYMQQALSADGSKPGQLVKVKVLPSTPAGLSQTARRVLEEWGGGMSHKGS